MASCFQAQTAGPRAAVFAPRRAHSNASWWPNRRAALPPPRRWGRPRQRAARPPRGSVLRPRRTPQAAATRRPAPTTSAPTWACRRRRGRLRYAMRKTYVLCRNTMPSVLTPPPVINQVSRRGFCRRLRRCALPRTIRHRRRVGTKIYHGMHPHTGLTLGAFFDAHRVDGEQLAFGRDGFGELTLGLELYGFAAPWS